MDKGIPKSYITTTNRFFKGGNLLDELSFVCYYHKTFPNQLLHLIGITGFYLFIFAAFSFSSIKVINGISAISILFLFCGIGYHFKLDYNVGLFESIVLTTVMILAERLTPQLVSSHNASVLYMLAPACFGIQLLGHVIFEGRFPAFRPFEAVQTTPFFLFLNIFFWFGYKPELRKKIYEMSTKWSMNNNM